MLPVVILYFCLIGADSATQLHELFNTNAMKMGFQCLEEVGATEDTLQKIANREIPTSREGMCLITCIHQKFGMQNSDGTTNRAGTLLFLEALKDDPFYSQTKDHFMECLDTVSNDDEKCVIGAKFMECLSIGGMKKGIL
uniref:Odorant binding protein 6 n=1 Tax=Holotrichia oblita TaxID=644536 RepID=A0A3Q8SMI8_HOLOL|nr:odorant binding protein 6 [Holotrichia oblita]